MREWRGLILMVVVAASIQVCRTQDAASPSLVIEPMGSTLSVPAYEGFVLTCRGTGARPELFKDMKWISPRGEEIHENDVNQVIKSGGDMYLSFNKPSVEDSGLYNCTAKFQTIDTLEASIEIRFYQDVTWEDCPKKQALTINLEGIIRCRVSANPPALVTWFKDGHALSDRYSAGNDGISVSGITKADEGDYSIRAMVPRTGKFHSRTISVSVNIPPQIVSIPESVEAVEGEEAKLMCEASGSPKPMYQWFDPSKKDLGKEGGYRVGTEDGTLIIPSVKREHKGQYTCRAKNDAGQAESVVKLNVIVKPSIVVFDNLTAPDQGKAQFECRANGDPPPKITIKKDVNVQPFSSLDTEVDLEERRDGDETVLLLTIQSVKLSDDGLYYCNAENKGGKVEKVGHLTVEYAPVMSVHPDVHIKTWDNNPVNLTCVAKSIPNATITWWFNGQEIRGTEQYYTIFGVTSESNLMVSPSREFTGYRNVYGSYKCTGKNTHGTADISMTLEEAHAPGPLLQVNFKKVTPTTITFEFMGPKDDGGLPIRAFVVEYREEDSESKIHEWSESVPYILEKLKPRAVYIFRFAAKNNVGIGEWTEDTRRAMPAEAAPDPPAFISDRQHSPYHDKLEVKWTIPQDNGREIESFILRYFKVVKVGNGWKMDSEPVERVIKSWVHNPKYLIEGLDPASYYKVEVRATNKIGQSKDATTMIRTAEGTHPEGQSALKEEGNLPWPVIAGITLVVVLVVLIILDVTCYLRYRWGVVYILRRSMCGRPESEEKAKAAIEDSKGIQRKVPMYTTNEDDKYAEDKVTEDTPMIENTGAKDGKIIDANNIDADLKNKSPKGSKSSIAKDSAV